MHPIINIATTAARNATKIILRSLDKLDSISIAEKKPNDFVTEIDQQVEQEIIQTIFKAYPEHAILAEESGVTGDSDYVWIIDPIDGTLNFMHGHPHFSIAIAVKHKNKIEHGLIYDPLRDELFHATRGAGAFLNNRRIRVSTRKTFAGASIGTGYGHKHPENLPHYLAILGAMLPQAAGIRRSGSAALDFAYVACGRIDGFWEFNLAPWDIAAGSLIVKEAGGLVGDFNGEEHYLETGNVLAGNPKIFKLLLQTVKANV
jgi:myo-inositol-1(or 4)-monophosphatase